MADPYTVLGLAALGEIAVDDAAGDAGRGGHAHGAGHGVGLMHLLHEDEAADDVDVLTLDVLAVEGVVALARRDDGEERSVGAILNGVLVIVGEAHLYRAAAADLFDLGHKRRVALDLLGSLDAAHVEGLGLNEHGWDARVDHGDLVALAVVGHDGVNNVIGRKELAGDAADAVGEVKLDRGAESGNTVDMEVAVNSGLAVTNLDLGVDDGVGVDLMDADGGVGLNSLDNAVVYRKGCNAGGDVAAVGLVVDLWLDEADLTEGIIDVRIFSAGRADYRKLAGEDVRTPRPSI